MTYIETINYLFEKLPMFSRIGAAAYKKDLTNTIALCEAIGNPHHQFKSIHIAGTNGKGSTSHMLAAILQTAGYKTGLYTSPHLHDFRERIKVNGELCSEEFVVRFTEKIKPLIEKIEPSFFEITVAMAFAYFAAQKVDIAIIEVGLGGRLDSTNVINPELCIITNIGWDHMQLLGNSLPDIAREKAGIIKAGVPVVIGETTPETKPVFELAAALSPIHFSHENRYVHDWLLDHDLLEVTVVEKNQNAYHKYQLDLPGFYQTKNLVAVLEAVNLLHKMGWNTTQAIVTKALSQVKKLTGLHGRWELLHKHPTIIADVGHNIDGINEINKQLELMQYHKLHMVIGMVKDKDIGAVLSLLPHHAQYYFTKAQIPRALDELSLQALAMEKGLHGNSYLAVNEAINAAINNASSTDLILVCGSVFLVGEIDKKLWHF
jgi:dihydrofolate synthase / folylpolyglutamate synthase